MRNLLVLCAVAVLMGCASMPLTQAEYYAGRAAGRIGCPASEIVVDNISARFSDVSYRATCRGVSFYCTDEAASSAGVCAPEIAQH